MTDELYPTDYRKEPTLEGRREKPSTNEPRERRLDHERRDERHHVRVDVPFQVQFEGTTTLLPGDELSLGGFSVLGKRDIEPGKVFSASLLIITGAAEIIVPLTARALRSRSIVKGKDRLTAFEIVRIEPQHRELLRRVIRSHLSGRYASVEQLIEQEDPQTQRKRSSTATPANRPAKRSIAWGRYSVLILAAVTLVAVAGATAYRNFMLIEPSFAAVTAPRVDIRAPGPGTLVEHNLTSGDMVERDQRLVSVNNSQLETDLILARASFNYNEQLINNMRELLDDPNANQVVMPDSTTPRGGSQANFENVSPQIAQARIDQFETVRDYESSRIDALESRMSANTIYSPCDCQVAWALSSIDGVYVDESERIMTLLQTGPNDIMAEALVHMDDIAHITPHQKAYIALPNASEPIAATVRTVALDVDAQPRAGFPQWVRQQQNVASVLLVPEEPLPASAVGIPVDVRFSEAPVLDSAVEWIWQGGRAVVQQVSKLFGSSTAKDDGAVITES